MTMKAPDYLYFEADKVGKLRNLRLHVRQAMEGFITGLHQSPHRGFSAEFADHREYAPGDDLRHLDWVAWARSDRYFLKQYEQQTNLRAHILLDVSGSMNYRHGDGITKFQYGCLLASCLSYLMCRQQDVVGLVAFDERVRFNLPPGSSPAHMDRIFRYLEQAEAGRSTSVASTFHDLARTIAKRGLVIVISDLCDEPSDVIKALQHFVFKKHQVIVFHVMDPSELSLPFGGVRRFVDMETGQSLQIDADRIRQGYIESLGAFIQTYRRQCADRNIEYVLTTTDAPYDRLLLDYLAKRRTLMKR